MTERAAHRETVRLAAAPLLTVTVVAAALVAADLPWLAAVAGIVIALCVVACVTVLVVTDRTSQRALSELAGRSRRQDHR